MKTEQTTSTARQTGALCLALLLPVATAHSGELAQTPLYLSTNAPPNIFFLHDDSNSMDSETLITGLTANVGELNDETNSTYRFHETNPLYYNPKKTYSPWPGPNHNDSGKPFKDMDITKARVELGKTVGTIDTRTRDLTREPADLTKGTSHYDKTKPDGTNTAWGDWCALKAPGTTCRGWRYYYRETAGGPVKRQWVADLDDAGKTNFANWYTYHRSRKNVAKNAIGMAMSNAPGKRFGYGTINDVLVGPASDIAFISDNNSAKVFEKLYDTMGNGFTPLQMSLDWVGRYYETGVKVNNGETTYPSPILSNEKGGACQLNSTILITDGYYNGDIPGGIGNADGDKNSPFDGPPYSDSHSNTLADIAMHYFERDLSPLPNNVKSTDGATHQHMNTYTISLGLKGNIANPGTVDINTLTWPNPQANDAAKIDDLFHAAINGRGSYSLADNPDNLIAALNSIVTGINDPRDSSNTIATSAFRLSGGDRAIATSFDPAHWSGTVMALKINNDGTLDETTPAWSSDETLPFNSASREIITYDGTAGKAFRWDDLTTAQRSSLYLPGDSETYAKLRLDYLRGQKVTDPDTSDTITFRERATVLGDIVNSSPVYVGAPVLLYPDAAPFGASGERYSKFWKETKDRTPVVYVGANDGMLHGFRVSDGKELLAYVPNAIFPNLKNISAPSFDSNHQYFVDQTPTVSDAYVKTSLEGEKWRTVLVSGLGAGGRGLFALDITNPANFSESKASTIALWEFTSTDDKDLGYTLAKPVIAMTENDKWVVISGNGENSENGKAVLFILNLDADASDGWDSEYTKIKTNDETGNALFSPAAVDSDGNGKVDRVYAGDLKGNIWVFDLKDNSSKVLFTATDSKDKAQPVTSKPTVIRHPTQATTSSNKPNMLVLFGTGRYLNRDDLSNSDDQSFYAVWDDGSSNLTRAKLLNQKFTEGTDTGDLKIEARRTENVNVKYGATDGKQHGWYIELDSKGKDPSERVVTSASVYQGIVFFTTYIPSDSPCDGGGSSWFMFLKAYNGGPPDQPIISINKNRTIEAEDVVTLHGTTSAPSGLKIEGGAFGVRLSYDSAIIGTVDQKKGVANYAHNLGATANLGKRISWRELRRE